MASSATTLVTGASSGIGMAVSRRLRREGSDVIAVGRNAEALRVLAAECGVRPFALDVRDATALASTLGDMDVDVLVSCAGILSTRSAFQDIDPEEIDAMVGVNLLAPMRLARLLLPGMISRRRGHLIFLGSSAGRWPHPNVAVYGASKAGLSMFCDALRCDLLGSGVRVTEVAPGRVETQLYRTALGDAAPGELYDGYASIQPEDIAELVLTAMRLPPNVDVSRMEVFPTDQAVGGSRIVRTS